MARLVVWSDYVCPFCFVGHARVERLRRDFPALEIEWRGFEIHPEIPPEGAPLDRVLHPAVVDRARRHVEALAAEEGLAARVPGVIANSRRAHQAAAFARERGVFNAFHENVMRAFWERGENVGDESVLVTEWSRAGGKAADLETFFMEAPRDAPAPSQAEAADAWVTGVPTFDVLGERLKRRVVGAQPYVLIRGVVDEVLAADAEVTA